MRYDMEYLRVSREKRCNILTKCCSYSVSVVVSVLRVRVEKLRGVVGASISRSGMSSVSRLGFPLARVLLYVPALLGYGS